MRAAATYQSARRYGKPFTGTPTRRRRKPTAALALTNGRDVEYAPALRWALSGDSSRSDALADDLDKRFPEERSSDSPMCPFFVRYPRCTVANPGKRGATANRASLRTGCEWAQRGTYI